MKKTSVLCLSIKVPVLAVKPIVLLSIFSMINLLAFAQNQDVEYVKIMEYAEDDKGRAVIPIKNAAYNRIRAKDSSSWGYQRQNGDIVIPLGKYKFLNPIDKHGMILAHKNGKCGYIDIHENILIPFDYDDIGVFSVDLAPVIKNNKQGFINRKGDLVIPLEYDALSYVTYFYAPGNAILIKNGKYGVIDSLNQVVVPFKYDKIKWSDNKDCFIATTGNDWTSFAFDGKQMSGYNNYEIVKMTPLGYLPPDSKDLPVLVRKKDSERRLNKLWSSIEYHNGSKKVKDSLEVLAGGEYAYIDKAQNVIVPFGTYDYAEPFGLGRKAIVAKGGLYGIIDEYGKPALPLVYDFVERPSQYSHYADIFVAVKENIVTILDKDVNKIPIGGLVSYNSRWGDLIVSNAHGKNGLVSYQGELTIPILYDTLYSVRHGGYIAVKDDLYGYISPKGNIIKPFEYRTIYDLRNELVFVNADNKAGLCDKKGREIIPFEYEAIYDTWYNNSDPDKVRYIVVKNGRVGTVDGCNNVIIPIIYEGLSGWVEYGPKAHFVKNNGKYGLISHEGDIIIPIEYDYVGLPARGVIVVRKDDKYGVVSWQNKEILPCVYDMIMEDIPVFDSGAAQEPKLVVLQNNIWAYFTIQGNRIRNNISADEIQTKYGYQLKWGKPSSEYYDMKQAPENE